MSKMGVSTVASYTGAQIFEAVGLSQTRGRPLLHRYDVQARRRRARRDRRGGRPAARHGVPPRRHHARPTASCAVGGEYQWRREGEPHLFDPETVFRLQHSTRNRRYDVFKQYTARVDEQSERLMTLRGLFRFKDAEATGRTPIPIDEVEPVSEIVKRFSTGAMSYGSISQEAHETLAIAMNRLGAKSNTGEGGEDADRLHDPERRSADQAGRLGPLRRHQRLPHQRRRHPDQDGAGRQARRGRPAARARRSTRGWPRPGTRRPGVGLISPPPHHDIYSIEDLAQLIHDLKNANPRPGST